ncbi:hypothetical protein [Bradyrhizobium sp. CCBAU 51745]|uniref:hypothetical protein n=1 Tax=Bradyrhizobium sp. CCBAU 51745 TaxID=1325099 RepID=UPI0023068F13|nr:hypothetical protein [Bradyrhizobium sp. CCBAU 51745]
MPNSLTVSRFGLFISRDDDRLVEPLAGDSLVQAFRSQAAALAQRLYGSLAGSVPAVEIVASTNPSSARSGTHEKARFDTLIAKLPRIEETITFASVPWIISRRITLTSSALQSSSGRSKLWLSIHGMPQKPNRSQSGARATAFLAWVNQNELHLLSELRAAFVESLRAVPKAAASGLKFRDGSVRLNFTDDDTKPVAHLVDAIHYDHIELNQLRTTSDEELRKGLETVDHFASHAFADHKLKPKKFSVLNTTYGMQAVVCRLEGAPRYSSLLSGVARHMGDGGGYQDELDKLDAERPLSLDQIRSRSAALHISAGLASAEALRLERRVRTQAGHTSPAFAS